MPARRVTRLGAVLVAWCVVAACGGATAPGAGSGDASPRDGASSDGALGDDGSSDGAIDIDAAMCFEIDGGVEPPLRACTQDQDCVARLRQPCCGPMYAVGVAKTAAPTFDACESSLEAKCPPGLGCDSGPTYADDHSMGDFAAVKVSCSAFGSCVTTFK